MKKFEIYKDIRCRALIFGLSVPMFALQMIGVIGSLLVVIFSFSFSLVIGAMFLNGILYVVLIKLVNRPGAFDMVPVFPKSISNKKTNLLRYGH